jgi:lipoprotein-anchoring transpeptidase ErfK/SrfK
MPDRRPPPVRLDLKAQTAKRPAPKSKKPPKRPRKPRAAKEDSSLLYWIAGVLIFLLLGFAAVYYETPKIKSWFAGDETPPENLLPLPQKPEVQPSSQPSEEEIHLKKLKAREEAEAKKKLLLAEQQADKALHPTPPNTPLPKPVAKVVPPPPPLIIPPGPLPENPPPLVQPVPLGGIKGAPPRAMPVDLNKLDTERIAAYQVALERIHFSCGFVDGDQGMRTQRMLRAFQASRNLPITGFLDQPTRDAIGEPGEPFLTYTVTADDVDSIMPKPTSWIAKSKATRLGYNDIWELLAEKFHCTRAYLKGLNPGVTTPVAGTEIIGPKVYPAAPIPHASSLRISLSDTSIEALDASGKIIGFFPCSIAKDKAKRPHGLLTVKVVDPNPDYTFDPALFADASKAEGITHKLTIPPGPRNPVGTTWVGLSLPGYGIHGTPEPENISRTQSHGCFRLANWNAQTVLKMVRVGTPVDVVP